ncbi:cytochrome c family protein [Burkholderia pseudomallei MSHR983]|uniref:c-type cytochrome n=1 Tax=Burkholderia pseudomallei TaxID=28450 RepID=UPI00053654A5|nr:c-type cytochrome [Burkholderia pseudomallei]KAA8760690.1 cytochrome c5 family protein [Burkholderia pseudomallei]KGU63707.1 cytochrome c family protein [Burkholderia pseudomallei MSHR983]KGW60702.1 cytochrome c family protein [Burkholderia pseudomallei MSHR1357]KKC16077.1 cytochrome c family protein [Burkholderia pseudomallei MSHR1328]OMW46467.1 cytochrome C [Burkholderia pseudomallei]
MKLRNLSITAAAFALAFGLSACGQRDAGAPPAAAASASIAPAASVTLDASANASPSAASAPAASSEAAPAATTAAAADTPNPGGEKVFKSVCSMCHQTGAAGAPIAGNKDDWAPRIAQGKPTLYKHALEGFTGNKGTMPPRGGNPSLKDNEVEAAVDFMVAKAH